MNSEVDKLIKIHDRLKAGTITTSSQVIKACSDAGLGLNAVDYMLRFL
jgi:hypothetical protein